jgi:type II secretory pathway pseudopilin PulG
MRGRAEGFTFVELMFGAVVLAVAIVGLLGAFLGQTTLNEHARNLAWALNDAGRILERMRQLNTGASCAVPTLAPPAGFASWDAWLASPAASGGGGKSVQPNAAVNERVAVSSGGVDPLQVTVAVCWRHRGRTLGECAWDGTQLTPADLDGDGLITSPAMLSTLISCRR